MDQGRIVEKGKHAELLANEGLYYHLYKAQFETALAVHDAATELMQNTDKTVEVKADKKPELKNQQRPDQGYGNKSCDKMALSSG